MNLKTTFIILTFLTLSTTISCGQTTVSIPKEFVETTPPKVGSDEWYSLNYSRNEFRVKIVDGKLDIKKIDEVNKCELEISGGTLIGINRGEWGGQLSFKPTDKTQKVVDIKNGNIKFIFSYKDKIYFI